ncbi:type 2 lanthipeptide synthetase LanM family protein [Streptomyces sp. NPDC051051]|uniref:type 2 lanthipeptide synthetase LanM family protein n=1 Tax=Streptomyces sp. NPDC051051 TaxID=3155666 RepID=UPI003417F29D
MTETADLPASRTASLPTPLSARLPLAWWAPALTLAERLAAPGVPAASTSSAAEHAPWDLGDGEGFALRLAHLRVDGATAAALAAETAERLAGRVAKPDWADYIEAALAAAPESLDEPTADGTGPHVFAAVVRPLVIPAADRLALRTVDAPASEQAVWRDAFEQRLTEQLTRQAARTLVHELSQARGARRLAGADPRERFASFIAATGSRPGLSALFTTYPVLARMLARTALDAAEAVAELVTRFQTDREDLVIKLLDGCAPGALAGVNLGLGDAHQGNRAVAILCFADGGRLVYKPRPLEQHGLLDDLATWLDAKVPGLALRTPRSVRRPEYGWLEFVEHRWCQSGTETDAFYRRQGMLLALLYAVDGADMHYENVIACGDQPVLVDAETLLHTGLPQQAMTAGADPAADALQASVHRTCLLPHLLIGQHGALDISALGRNTEGVFPSEGLYWEDSGKDTMRAVRGAVLSPAAQNQPLPAGVPLEIADHRAALLEGFRAGYAALAAHGRDLLAPGGPLAEHADSPARLITRSTRLYTTLLEESAHPSLLGDALAREGVFAVLWTESEHDEARQRLIEHETAELWRGDVPLFVHRPSGTGVRTADGTWLPDVLPVAALTSVGEKLARMDEIDCHDQEWIISATLAARGTGSPLARRSELALAPLPAVVPDVSRLLAAVCGIADEIAARAVRSGGRTNWLGLEQVSGPHWAVLPMGAGLGQGYCGVALFLAQADALTGAGRYAALAQETLRPLPALMKALAADPELSAAAGPGAYAGLAGVVHTLVRLSTLLHQDLTNCLPDALTALGHAVAACSDPGLAGGAAGALTAAVAAHEATGAPEALRLADAVADLLLATVRKPDRPGPPVDATVVDGKPGFADGAAGIGWALQRYAGCRPERAAAHAEAADTLLRAAVRTVKTTPVDLSWSTGLAGVAAAAPLSAASALTPSLANAEVHPHLSLERGMLGTLEALAVLAGRGDTVAARALPRYSGQVLALVETQSHHCATPDHVPSPGLLTGLSGIGYGLLRLAHPETVPSLLLLEDSSH